MTYDAVTYDAALFRAYNTGVRKSRDEYEKQLFEDCRRVAEDAKLTACRLAAAARVRARRQRAERARELQDLHWSTAQIARELGVTAETVRRDLTREPT